MKIVSRDFFSVVNRDQTEKEEIRYHLNFFYLTSLKKSKRGSFSFVSVPFFKGFIILGLDFKNRMRVLKFDKILKTGELKPIDPDLFEDFLLSPLNKYIAFSNQASKIDKRPFLEMLKSLQFDFDKIITLTFCESCLAETRFKILDTGYQIKSFNNQIICPNCAEKIVFRRGESMGLLSSQTISGRLKGFFRHLILKFKDIEKVLKSFKPDFNPIKDEEAREITLYDIEKTTPINKKYLNYSVTELDIPNSFKTLLKNQNITTLLPIQAISVDQGLLSKNNNQLVMAPTSGGKTLIGELAGVSKLLQEPQKQMLYLVPIVALANIRYNEFEKKYAQLGLKVVRRVGESLLDENYDREMRELKDAQIIIATYEAIDFILRSGNKEKLGIIGTIIIDEIQTLIDPERGFLLDGLISRLKTIHPTAQYLYLSATVGAPKTLATKLDSILIQYKNRPVPIERHLLLCQNERIKINLIKKLIRAAFSEVSEFGYRGQTIVFTNARKKCEAIAGTLRKVGILVKAYHSGLTNEERKEIEYEFQTQKIAGVVATAALAAGVDLPASQVIFESLAMGIKWLSVADFEQMLGRAGRLKKHSLGRAYLLVQPEKVYSPAMKKTEEEISIRLLNGKIKDFEQEPNEDRILTEILAFISIYEEGSLRKDLNHFYDNLINGYYELHSLTHKLLGKGLISQEENGRLKITELGRAVAKSFLTIEQSFEVIDLIKSKHKSIQEIVLNLRPLKNVYLSKSVVADLAKNVNMKYFSNNFFSSSVVSLMDAEYVKKRKKFSQNFIDLVLKWIRDIFNCKCKDNPYCECGRLNLEKIILELRTEDGFSIEQIHEYLEEYYKILVFKGDLIDYLENLIYSFESIKSIVEGIKDLSASYKVELQTIPSLIADIRKT
ncbi:MAG: putative ski2-type helicase [Promethearchaeota archaeon]|nr:MAG: putative ski2-type helicase [Candidatus Lokiarchaeota archaeon]